MNHPLRCRCGTLRGHVVRPGRAYRAVCYCRDCQAYAHFLGQPDTLLDAHGGTTVVATVPQRVALTAGLEALACMSLSERGLLRWYAACCRTPIANTPRHAGLPYVGVAEPCLQHGPPSVQDSFGPVRMAVNTRSAKGAVPTTALGNLATLPGIMAAVLGARLSGGYRRTPFFDPRPARRSACPGC